MRRACLGATRILDQRDSKGISIFNETETPRGVLFCGYVGVEENLPHALKTHDDLNLGTEYS